MLDDVLTAMTRGGAGPKNSSILHCLLMPMAPKLLNRVSSTVLRDISRRDVFDEDKRIWYHGPPQTPSLERYQREATREESHFHN